ncbi:hypothetical protein CR513_21937, partial [Mucuna pruriens]
MKFPVGRRVGSVWADSQVAQRCYEDSLRVGRYMLAGAMNALDLDLDPRGRSEHKGPHPAEDLKEIQLGFQPEQTMKIGTVMNPEEENPLVTFLKANHDVFAWSARDMPGVDPNSERLAERPVLSSSSSPSRPWSNTMKKARNIKDKQQ